jgi:hypothetical protein
MQAQRGGGERRKAIAALNKLKIDYPGNGSEKAIDELVEKYPVQDAQAAQTVIAVSTRNELLERLRKAGDLSQQKKFREAAREYYAIAREAPVNDEVWKQADGAMKAIKDTEQRLGEDTKKAEEGH